MIYSNIYNKQYGRMQNPDKVFIYFLNSINDPKIKY